MFLIEMREFVELLNNFHEEHDAFVELHWRVALGSECEVLVVNHVSEFSDLLIAGCVLVFESQVAEHARQSEGAGFELVYVSSVSRSE